MAYLKRKYTTKYALKSWYDIMDHLWFCFHHMFFGGLVREGRKIRAFNDFKEIKRSLKLKEHQEPNLIFLVAFMKIMPKANIRKLYPNNDKMKVPLPMSERQCILMAINWILRQPKKYKNRHHLAQISQDIVDSIYERSTASDARIQLHKDVQDSLPQLKRRHLLRKRRIFLFR